MLKKAEVSVRGTRPFLWHAFTEEALSTSRKVKGGVAGNDPDEWKKTVLATDKGLLFIKPSYIFGSLKNGATFIKVGRGTITKKVAATLIVLDDIIYMKTENDDHLFLPSEEELDRDATKSVYLDVTSVVNPNTKGRNIRYRVAAKYPWFATFNIQWDATVVSEIQMKETCEAAGVFSGLGDGRGVGNGRYEIDSFEVSKD
ncbi:hypothetical protein LCGC14_0456760 [marine sediment metagenome]|uniref:Uncharacterized protein n=1 Tax=marine sediment metagenome TaxID=412755 RepID=A0A0F9SLI8_9ZZZZ